MCRCVIVADGCSYSGAENAVDCEATAILLMNFYIAVEEILIEMRDTVTFLDTADSHGSSVIDMQ